MATIEHDHQPAPIEHASGHETKAETTGALQDHVHSVLKAGGNLAPSAEAQSKERAGATALLGHVHIGSDAHGPAKAEAKPAAPNSFMSQATSWLSHSVDKVEQAGEKVLHSPTLQHAETAAANYAHNALDIGKTLGVGVGEAAMNTARKVEHGVVHAEQATVHGAVDAGKWVYHHPGEAVAITAGVVAVGAIVVGAELATGGLATGAIVAAAEAVGGVASTVASSGALGMALQVGGYATAGIGTLAAGLNVAHNGELGTLMHQQDVAPAVAQQARERLKADTGTALLADSMLGAGAVASSLKLFSGAASTAASADVATSADTAAGAAAGAGQANAADVALQTEAAQTAESTLHMTQIEQEVAVPSMIDTLIDSTKQVIDQVKSFGESLNPITTAKNVVDTSSGLMKNTAKVAEAAKPYGIVVASGDHIPQGNGGSSAAAPPKQIS